MPGRPVAASGPSAASPDPPAGAPGPPAATPGPAAATPGPAAAIPGPPSAAPGPSGASPDPRAATPSPSEASPGPPAGAPAPSAATPGPPAAPPGSGAVAPGSTVVARGLVKRYGLVEAVRGIDFEIGVRECFGFLGPNGAGKTTTMRMIACAAPPTAGTLTVLGQPVERARRIKRRMGVVPQENNLDEEVSVVDNLLIYARYFDIPPREARPRALALLAFVALDDKRDWRIQRLSGGMKRRLLIARALINEPDLLVLDEPTTGLDPQARHLVWEKLRALKREGVTLVLTTHYMEEAAQLCDRLVIMHEGRILVEGAPRALIARETSPQVVEVFEPPAETQPRLLALAARADRIERLADRWLFYTGDGEALLALVRAVVPDRGAVWLRGGSLEDVFLRLTGRGLLE
jgi:lipooligosaccharide transport system ATP-binding protein